MANLRQFLEYEVDRIVGIIDILQKRMIDAPKGSLRVSKNNKYVQYYHCTPDNKMGKYIPKQQEELIQQLIQKTYDRRVLKLAEKRLKQFTNILKDYEDDEIERIFYNEHPEKQPFIEKVEPTWEERCKKWKEKEYEPKGFQEGSTVIMTERGERVRSKSEKIMADYFFRNGIEYKYECPKYLNGIGIVYPDFTFLHPKTGEEIYREHCGMVDVPSYARKMVQKIDTYENNGIFQGERLIVTYETENSILGTKKIEQMVEQYLK